MTTASRRVTTNAMSARAKSPLPRETEARAQRIVNSAVGGIPEVVADGLTGTLVPYHAVTTEEFEAGLADAINTLCAEPARAAAMGRAGRERAVHDFSWETIAHRTVELYESLLR